MLEVEQDVCMILRYPNRLGGPLPARAPHSKEAWSNLKRVLNSHLLKTKVCTFRRNTNTSKNQ